LNKKSLNNKENLMSQEKQKQYFTLTN